ncbi:hypothetical protein GWI33_022367 [Rhynchophorus ferrugineus]|uniref:Uncharacterized protein n=1 Tax=Rhynchophorus ferrugineus TaxID=354439 RepID=A0A834IUL5_RHYFE|nr:hypothetical protein GWI33_022367 [Rhynchophorus ferrugineus]
MTVKSCSLTPRKIFTVIKGCDGGFPRGKGTLGGGDKPGGGPGVGVVVRSPVTEKRKIQNGEKENKRATSDATLFYVILLRVLWLGKYKSEWNGDDTDTTQNRDSVYVNAPEYIKRFLARA